MEHEYGLVGGNIFHGELSPGQLFHMRPAPGLRRLPHADRGLVPGEQRDARRRRRHRHPRHERRAPDRARSPARVGGGVRRPRVAYVSLARVRRAMLPGAGRRAARPIRCGSRSASSAPIGSLDLTEGTTPRQREIWQLQYPTLTTFDLATLAPIPGLADAWTPTADGSGFTYTPARRDLVGRPTGHRGRRRLLPHARARRGLAVHAAAGSPDSTRVAVDEQTVTITARGRARCPRCALHVVPQHLFDTGTDADADGSRGFRRLARRRALGGRGAPAGHRPAGPARARRDRLPLVRGRGRASRLRSPTATSTSRPASPRPTYPDAAGRSTGRSVIHANDGDQWVLQVASTSPWPGRRSHASIDRDALVQSAVDGVGRGADDPDRRSRRRLAAAAGRGDLDLAVRTRDRSRASRWRGKRFRRSRWPRRTTSSATRSPTAVIDDLDEIGITVERDDDDAPISRSHRRDPDRRPDGRARGVHVRRR